MRLTGWLISHSINCWIFPSKPLWIRKDRKKKQLINKEKQTNKLANEGSTDRWTDGRTDRQYICCYVVNIYWNIQVSYRLQTSCFFHFFLTLLIRGIDRTKETLKFCENKLLFQMSSTWLRQIYQSWIWLIVLTYNDVFLKSAMFLINAV